MSQYDQLKRQLATGWNTWNTRSVTSHVLLPEGLAINLGFKDRRTGRCLRHPLIGRQGEGDEVVHPSSHAYDGSYTELTLRWAGSEIVVQSALCGDDLLLLITPLASPSVFPSLVIELAMLWNQPGALQRKGNSLRAKLPRRDLAIFPTKLAVDDFWVDASGPCLVVELDGPVGIATDGPQPLDDIYEMMEKRKAEHVTRFFKWGQWAEAAYALQACLAWDTIFEPAGDRVISPVSRLWNCDHGGFVLFEWDSYFAGWLAAVDNRELAYANVIEITRSKTEAGFVPNFTDALMTSRDRSQPPVGSLAVREIFRRYREPWLVQEVFDDLLAWNRWWPENRDTGGLLCWGSNPYAPAVDAYWESEGVNDRFGAALESGLDNSPMYDDIPFDRQRHQLLLQDVGLTSLYIADCRALADLAMVAGRESEGRELTERAEVYAANMASLWDEETGLFLNRRVDTGEFQYRLSPCHFYPLLAKVPTAAQAARMIKEHFYNRDEFWGEWILPSIARNDPAYHDQNYWRGRIWAPMNFLVYLGLRNYDLAQAQQDLARRSLALLMKEWRDRGHIHENYNADTGEGCDIGNSDRFYHWSGLLGLIPLIQECYVEGPELPL
jgi:putative isomerase